MRSQDRALHYSASRGNKNLRFTVGSNFSKITLGTCYYKKQIVRSMPKHDEISLDQELDSTNNFNLLTCWLVLALY